MTEVISSAANPLVKRVRLLADRRHRRREGEFVVEGVQPVWRAVEAGWSLEALLVCPDLLGDSPAVGMVRQQQARGVRVVELTQDLFERISDRDGPSGLAAVVRSRPLDVGAIPLPADGVLVALHEVANPGNLGTIVRTADAAGACAVLLVGRTADPYAPAAVKASMGSLFGIPVGRFDDADTFLDWAVAHGVQVVATSGYAEQVHWDAPYRRPVAVLLGSEGDGLPEPVLARADLRVRIPMTGTAESLNLAVAAAVMLYELRRPGPA
jgi:TrmH family RNA methyltransferase